MGYWDETGVAIRSAVGGSPQPSVSIPDTSDHRCLCRYTPDCDCICGGFHIWDGQLMVDGYSADSYLAEGGSGTLGCGGIYQFWLSSLGQGDAVCRSSPNRCQKIWGLSHASDQEVLWSHWGQFFLYNHRNRQTTAVEPLKDTMESG